MERSKTSAYAWNIVRTSAQRILRKMSQENPGFSAVVLDISLPPYRPLCVIEIIFEILRYSVEIPWPNKNI